MLTFIINYCSYKLAESSNLLVMRNDFQSAPLSELTAEYYLDTSGSTSGAVLTYERESAILLSRIIHPSLVVTWNSSGDYAMEAPFEFGTWLTPLLLLATHIISCYEIASTIQENEYTREQVLRFLSLSEEPRVVMMHL